MTFSSLDEVFFPGMRYKELIMYLVSDTVPYTASASLSLL